MGIDLETLIILAVLAFILFGPEKLPEYAAYLGKFVAKMRQATTEMTRQYQDQNPFSYPPEPTLPPAPESTCPYCQQTVTLNFAFCPKCGHRLKEDHYPPPPQPPEPVAARPEPAPAPEPVQEAYPRIRPLKDDEIDRALAIINQAALAYKGVIPADCWHEPYMPEAELRAEIAAGVDFWGYEDEGALLGVMGRQDLVRSDPDPPRLRGPGRPAPGDGGPPVGPSPQGDPRPRPGGHLGRGLVGHPLLRETRLPAGHPDGERPVAQHLLDHLAPPGGNLGGPGGPQVVRVRESRRIIGRKRRLG